MRKIALTAIYVLTALLLVSCSAFGFGSTTSMPVIAVHSGADVSEENDSHFVELSKPFSNNSSDITSHEESNTSIDLSDTEESVEPNESSDNEESSRPEETWYNYNGFEVQGFSEEQIEEITTRIKAAIDKASAHVSVYYEDIATGFSFSYDGKRIYKAGSVTKAPYAKYLIASGVDLDEKLVLREKDKKDGSGVLKNKPAGSEYSVKELIEYAIVHSDNTAYQMLYQRFGFDSFNRHCQDLGVSTRLSYGNIWGDLTAHDAGVFFHDIYSFEKNDERSAFFMDSLRNTTYAYLLQSGVGTTPIAHKYGYMSAMYKVLHDAGIVYTDRPYIAVIMTDYDGKGGNGRSTFTEISSYFKAFAESLKNN